MIFEDPVVIFGGTCTLIFEGPYKLLDTLGLIG